MKKLIARIVISGLLASQLVFASDSISQKDAISILETSISKTNIFELPSFVMKADVQIQQRGKLLDGKYVLFWNGPQQWREDLVLPGYRELQVGGKGVVWLQRNADVIPFAVFNVHRALGFGNSLGPLQQSFIRLGLNPGDVLKKTTQRKKNGEKMQCFEFESDPIRSLEICRNIDTGVINRGISYDDREFQPVGDKVFPHTLSVLENGKTLAKVTITEWITAPHFAPDVFKPPANVSSQPGCMNPANLHLVKTKSPVYPENARRAYVEGTVVIDTRIGTDGVPKPGKLVESAGPDLDASSIHAIQEWRYEPSTCDGQPIEIETLLIVNYTLSHR